MAVCVLEPNPELEAFAIKHKKSRALVRPIPSVCGECNESFDSKTQLDEHTRAQHPKEPPFNDAKREQFLKLIGNEVLFYAACDAIKISSLTVRRAMDLDPSFRRAYEDANGRAAESIVHELIAQAKSGNLQAIEKALKHMAKSDWGDEKTVNVNVTGTVMHQADPSLLPHQNKVAELVARARARAELNGTNEEIIDVEIVE